MKALILAAGLGTRLLPHTLHTPKPLFTLSGRSILEITINRLKNAGCESVIINTHHLHHKIEAFIASQDFGLPVTTRHEPAILGTGGAVKNVSDFFDNDPFMVVNGDIITDIDFQQVYEFHRRHAHPATLVLHDYPQFNNVSVDQNGCITAFHPVTAAGRMAFTGIHVMDSVIFDFIAEEGFCDILEAYQKIISSGLCVKAFIAENHHWKDIGTPEAYKEAALDAMVPRAFHAAYPDDKGETPVTREMLKGDASDRIWYRFSANNHSLIVADHGIRENESVAEVDSFIRIGSHLYSRQLPVPRIFLQDAFSGLVFLEDLGDTLLQDTILRAADEQEVISRYESIIRLLGDFSLYGMEGFDTAWTCQTARYDKHLILEKECRYFVEAFLRGYLGMDVRLDNLKKDFDRLARKALEHAVYGLMHRDMQSRNIMVKEEKCFFIDFQGARLGPVQYDLASLIIDPYVRLPFPLQTRLMDFGVGLLSERLYQETEKFRECLNYCIITRNLQILGAFGFLSKVKNKTIFAQYIPPALNTLKHYLSALEEEEFSILRSIVHQI